MAERVVHLQPAGVEPAVADVDALAVSDVADFAGEVEVGRGVYESHGHGLGQFAGRIEISKQHVGDAVAVGLAGQPEFDDAANPVAPLCGGDGRTIAERNDDFRVDRCEGFDQCHLVGR